MTLAGCVALAGVAGGVFASLLTGLFLTSIQASFAATAHSYGYTDAGNAQFLFHDPGSNSPDLLTMSGRLPGFHMVFINVNDKGMLAAQEDEAQVFETDAEITFGTSAPRITGTVRERGGQRAEFPLEELYPEIASPTLTITPGPGQGRYQIRVDIQATSAEGDDLDYGLAMNVRVSADGFALDGDVEVDRVLTPRGGSRLTNTGTGEVEGRKQTGDQPPATDESLDEGDGQDESANANTDAGNDNSDLENDNGDLENENVEADPENGNAGDEEGEPVNENESADDNDNAAVEQGLITSEDCPELPATVIAFLNDVLGTVGVSALDVDGDGAASADEVHEVIDPVIAPLTLTDEAVVCLIRVVNG